MAARRHAGRGRARPSPGRPATVAQDEDVSVAAAGRAVGALGSSAEPASGDVLHLERQAGNRAVATAVQREPEAKPRTGRYGEPADIPDIRAALRAKYPALLSALSEDQLDRWQATVRYYRTLPALTRANTAAWQESVGMHGGFAADDPNWQRTSRDISRTLGAKPDEKITVDARALFADDIQQEPEWDVAAEMKFRQWAVDSITKSPLPVWTMPDPDLDDGLGRHVLPGLTFIAPKGFITADTLRNYYQDEYGRQVGSRIELRKLHEALHEMSAVIAELSVAHKERSDKNREHPIVRHISEFLGSGHHKYPSIHIWDGLRALVMKAAVALDRRQFEMAVPLIAMAEQSTAATAEDFTTYEERVMSGAGTAVKWLNRMKTAGSIAAGIASGPLGLTGSALIAGGYTFVQEGSQRAAEVAYGQRENMGWASLIETAGITTVTALVGGALQQRFQAAMKVRLDAAGIVGKDIDIYTSAAAAMTSSGYSTSIELVLKHVVSGEKLPSSATEFADMIVDGAVNSVIMDVGLHPVNARVAKEYEAWKSGRAETAIKVPERATAAGEHHVATPEPAVAAKAVESVPRQLPDTAVRRLLTEGGGWDRLRSELQSGTGLGQNMPVAERNALMDRFEAYRTTMARDVASTFGGSMDVMQYANGRRVRVVFEGPESPQRIAQAREYLDAKQPGWEQRTGLEVATEAPPSDGRTAPVRRELAAHLRPAARHLAEQFVPVFDEWPRLTPMERAARLTDIVNRNMDGTGLPKLGVKFKAESGGHLDAASWEIVINRKLFMTEHPMTAEFADACGLVAHEARHALQWFRAARLHPGDMKDLHLHPDVVKAVEAANRGEIPGAEHLDPHSLEYAEAAEWYESVWGEHRQHRQDTLKRWKQLVKDYRSADADLQRARQEGWERPALELAEEHYRMIRDEFHRYDDLYRMLPEEVDAYKWGDHVTEAVSTEMHAELGRAIEAQRQAWTELQAAERVADEAAVNPKTVLTVAKRKEIGDAFARYYATVERLEQLQARIDEEARPAGRAAGQYATPQSAPRTGP